MWLPHLHPSWFHAHLARVSADRAAQASLPEAVLCPWRDPSHNQSLCVPVPVWSPEPLTRDFPSGFLAIFVSFPLQHPNSYFVLHVSILAQILKTVNLLDFCKHGCKYFSRLHLYSAFCCDEVSITCIVLQSFESGRFSGVIMLTLKLSPHLQLKVCSH